MQTNYSNSPQFSGGLRRQLSNPALAKIFNHQSLESKIVAADTNIDRLERHGDAIRTDENLAQGNVSPKRVQIIRNPAPFQAIETTPNPEDQAFTRARKYSELLRTWVDRRSMEDAPIDQIVEEVKPLAQTNGIVPPTKDEVRTVITNASEEFTRQAEIRAQQVKAQLDGHLVEYTQFENSHPILRNLPATSTAPSVPASSRSSQSSGFTTESEADSTRRGEVSEADSTRRGEVSEADSTRRGRAPKAGSIRRGKAREGRTLGEDLDKKSELDKKRKLDLHMEGSNGYPATRARYRNHRKSKPVADFKYKVGNDPNSRTGSPKPEHFKRTPQNP